MIESRHVAQISDFAFRLYTSLLLAADDAGRFYAAPDLVKPRVLPLVDCKLEDVSAALEELSRADMILLYHCKSERYLQVRRWQCCGKASVSKFPWKDGDYTIIYKVSLTRDGERRFVKTSILEAGEDPKFAKVCDSTPSRPHPEGVKTKPYTESESKTKTKSDSMKTSSSLAQSQILWSRADGWSDISNEDKKGWKEAYPACDVDRQLAEMDDWLRSNPERARRKRWRSFITKWLSKQQERGGDMKNAIQGVPARRVVQGTAATASSSLARETPPANLLREAWTAIECSGDPPPWERLRLQSGRLAEMREACEALENWYKETVNGEQ